MDFEFQAVFRVLVVISASKHQKVSWTLLTTLAIILQDLTVAMILQGPHPATAE
jgi:hypothetical protein